jgi:hypothetical protein
MFDQPFVMNWLGRIASIIVGGGIGFAYYKFIGCRTGVCPITSNPWISTLYGALIGALMYQ